MDRRAFINKLALLGLLVGAPLVSASTVRQKTNWVNKPHLPKRLQELYPCLYENHLIVAGALEQSSIEQATMGIMNASKDCYLFDLQKQTWRKGPNLPVKRHHLGLVSTKQGIMAIGGFAASKADPWQVRSDTFLLSHLNDHWHQAKPLPNPQAESGYANIAGNVHVISGRGISNGNLTDVDDHVFFDGTHWQSAAPLPVARNSGACVELDRGCIFIGGRIQDEQHENQSRVDFYDKRTDKWFELAPIPQACSGIAAAVKDHKVYVFGGEQYQYTTNQFGKPMMYSKTFRHIWQYDFTLDKWQTLPLSMTSTRHGLGAVTTNEGIYLIGGAERAGGENTTNAVELLKFEMPC
ncbi:Kelch repeat-containing protein [Pseudoalteromonas sp. T1lg23B]|uniref:Kelch repeat-containing protein n=1 Tax=Pseudoalteromonas sp. T1lg23B TaxID=2077097 RepID=UPI000CF68ACC|nr:kelch motif-containing protein [Pseudoalteromonas sp. T1lg23B]